MNFYISDLHFNHQSILKQNSRPFKTTEEMNQMLIQNWNRKVTDKDHVYIIGDLFYETDQPEIILSQLQGKKHLILGNHDAKWYSEKLSIFFESVQSGLEIVDQNHAIFMCHYPMVSYPKQSRAYMIHGHIHNDTLFDYWCILLKRNRILNAGVDINHFEPVTFKELLLNNNSYKLKIKLSYPMHLLSIRFHLQKLQQTHFSKEELYQNLTESFKEHIEFYREGLYLIKDYSVVDSQIDKIKNEIRNHPEWSVLVKNYDLVYIDESGNYSYLDYLDKESIYLK